MSQVILVIFQGRTNGTHVYRTCWLNIIYHYDAGRREPDKFHYPKERIQIG